VPTAGICRDDALLSCGEGILWGEEFSWGEGIRGLREEDITPQSIALSLKRCARLAAELPLEVQLIRDLTIEQLKSAPAASGARGGGASLGERLVDVIPAVLNDPRLADLGARLAQATATVEARRVPIEAITGVVAAGTAVTAYLFICVVAASYSVDGPLSVPESD
jgi:hypothetical protein